MNKVHFSMNSNEWETPQDLFDELDAEFHFTLDPCATKENAKCERFYTKEDDGLSKRWSGESVFMNPPYGREIGKWVRKAFENRNKSIVVGLIPVRTDTKYWHNYILHGQASEIRFIKGRIKFIGNQKGSGSAPFPSAIVIFK